VGADTLQLPEGGGGHIAASQGPNGGEGEMFEAQGSNFLAVS